jgi:hypothetical protein
MDDQRKLGGALRRMLNRALSGVFNRWRLDASFEAHADQKLMHALMKMKHARQAFAVCRWRSEAEHQRSDLQLFRYATTTFMNASLAAGWTSWLNLSRSYALHWIRDVACYT